MQPNSSRDEVEGAVGAAEAQGVPGDEAGGGEEDQVHQRLVVRDSLQPPPCPLIRRVPPAARQWIGARPPLSCHNETREGEAGLSMRRMPMLVAATLMLSGLLSGCQATVVGENPDGIWFREPFIGGGSMQAQATRHCAQYGKTAVYQGTLDPTQGYALPVAAYNCQYKRPRSSSGWWARQDSNLQPDRYERPALTN